MNITNFQEPELEFGFGRHIDVRFGIKDYYPFDSKNTDVPRIIRVGIVGTPQSIEGTRGWLEKCKNEIPAKETNKYNLFPKFCGFNKNSGFKSEVAFDSKLEQTIPLREIQQMVDRGTRNQVIRASTELYYDQIKYLKQYKNCDVVLCALPQALLEKILVEDVPIEPDTAEEAEFAETEKTENFRRMLKAKVMTLGMPIQLILPHTYGERSHRKTRLSEDRTVQDEATRAWNFFTALYYKASGTPWRLPKREDDVTTCYVGISFYESLDKASLQTSLAEIFNERGTGIVWRGAKLKKDEKNRQPHLGEMDAKRLLTEALDKYRTEHKNLPARIVVHKSSNYSEAELRGFQNALIDKRIELYDFLTLFRSDIRMFRAGAYPPLRGMKLTLDEDTHILYTRGSVPFYETYPGKYVPRCLEIRCVDVQQTPDYLCQEVLALTKMNWNNTEFDGLWPITIKGSRQVGDILKYVDPEIAEIEPRYSFYM